MTRYKVDNRLHTPSLSEINIKSKSCAMLNRMYKASVDQLQDINHQLFREHSTYLSGNTVIEVDTDQSDLIASAKL